MDEEPDLISATRAMDLERIMLYVEQAPSCVSQVDSNKNNVMHICVASGAAIRAKEIMQYYLDNTEVDLLQQNWQGLDPLHLAMSLDAEDACQMLEPHWHAQVNRRFPDPHDDDDDQPHLTIVRPAKNSRDPQPGPK